MRFFKIKSYLSCTNFWGVRLKVASCMLRIILASPKLSSSEKERLNLSGVDLFERGAEKSSFFPESPLLVRSKATSVRKLGRSTSKLNDAFISFIFGAVHMSIGICCSLLLDTSKIASEGSLNKASGRKSNLKRKVQN